MEEKIIERQTIKLKFDQLVIQQGKYISKKIKLSKGEKDDIIMFGANKIFKAKEAKDYTDQDIEEILKRGEEKTDELNKDIDKLMEKQTELLSNLKIEACTIYDF